MNNSSFDNWASSVRAWPWNLVGLVVIFSLFLIACGLFYEDFTTSLEGYRLWPTQKYNPWVIFLVAALPQLGQIGAAYAFIDRKIPALFIALMGFMLWDVFMDIYYKSYQFASIELSAAAIFESVLLFTLGSELLLAFTIGMLFRIVPGILKEINGPRSRSRSHTPAPAYKPNPTQVKVPKK